MKAKIFDDVFSIFHFILGLVTAITPYPYFFFILFLFVTYEIFESRTKTEIFYDCIEYFIGIVVGILISIIY